MSRRPLLLLLLAVGFGGPLAAQSAAGRWSVQLRGPVVLEHGDLRIAGDSGRLVLEGRDSAWQPLAVRRGPGDSITIAGGDGLRLVGVVEGDAMHGTRRDGETPQAWSAQRIQPGTDRWPVRPRVVVRQLVVGRDDSVARFSDLWRRRLLSPPALLAEHAALANAAGFPAGDLASIIARAAPVVLGLDPVGRGAARRQLELIAASPAADQEFRALFTAPDGGWRLDLHDVAWQVAAAAVPPGALAPDSLAVAFVRLGVLATRTPDQLDLARAAWQLWSRQRAAPAVITELLAADQRAGGIGHRGVVALLAGYDAAEGWWLRAVEWLMRRPWLRTAAGWTSPDALVATFWERDAIARPAILPHPFGAMQAVPVVGTAHLASLLLAPANAVATEYLGEREGRREALEIWRGLDLEGGSPLRLTMGPQSMLVGTPAMLTRSRLGGFLAAEPAIRIDPGIMPIFAVGTVLHEWQHLLLEAGRLADGEAPGLRRVEWGVHLVEADPWLGEGAAEWLTEELLGTLGEATRLFTLVEAEKRLAIGAGNPEDTHVLGYLLVRAAMLRVASRAEQRQLLIRHLHDPVALAAAVGLAGPSTVRIPRPPTLVVVPEVTFTVDGGVAERPVRRLIVPALPVEP